jgi:hypothetical protein
MLCAMRVSEHFKLERHQAELDFVDVDIYGDVPLYIDPRALRLLKTPWGTEAVALVQDFFTAVLEAIRHNDSAEGIRLLQGLHEPNETHLGLSKGKAKGSGLGRGLARAVYDSLSASDAIKSEGMLEDLEDTALLVEGIDRDRISDITTNLIREPLIRYTEDICAYYSIPLKAGISSGPLWSPSQQDWVQEFVRLPITQQGGKLLLVPKSIVRKKMDFDPGNYFNDYVLDFLAEAEISAGSSLVHLLKDKTPRVYKKELKKKYGKGKAAAVAITKKHPEILDGFRARKRDRFQGPLDNEDLSNTQDGPDFQTRLKAVTKLSPGKSQATAFHTAVERLLSSTLSPDLTFPHKEYPVHKGRKRIDISYTNAASLGFFGWLAKHYPAANVVVECKNYVGDPANPELDQLAGRFSPSRGQVGLLVCRSFKDKELFIERCRDTANDDRGWIVPLDDADLAELVAAREVAPHSDELWFFFRSRFDQLVN